MFSVRAEKSSRIPARSEQEYDPTISICNFRITPCNNIQQTNKTEL